MSVQTLLADADAKPSTASYMKAVNEIGKLPDSELVPVKIAILRNYTVEMFLPALKVEAARAGLRADIYLGDYNVIEQEALNPASALYASSPDVIVLALRIHTLAQKLIMNFGSLSAGEVADLTASVIERVKNILTGIRLHSSAAILLHNFEQPDFPALGFLDSQSKQGLGNVIRRLNLDLVDLVSEFTGVYIIDVEYLHAQVGYQRSIDHRYWQVGKAPYTFAFNLALAKEYAKPIRALKGKAKKCLVLDCDNTLWGGVIGEDGINGIKLGSTFPGSSYVDFHLAILDLYHRGILLAINSKNNESDAMEVFASHPDSRLKPEHFVAKRINWQDKASNLREIAKELNIGTDSLVFIDDSEFECNLVRSELPEVLTVHLPKDATVYRPLLQGLGVFDTLTLSAEDRQRSSMYRADTLRKETLTQAGSMEQYLESLDLVLTISDATDFAIPRIAQLTQKTNQFNLTTIRRSEDEIRALSTSSDYDVYFAELADKFDSSGIIAVAIVKTVNGEAEVDTLLMSCRVIGRGVEQAILAHIAGKAASRGVTRLLGKYLPTAKNDQVKDFYQKLNFTEIDSAQGTAWALDPSQSNLTPPTWFKQIIIGSEK